MTSNTQFPKFRSARFTKDNNHLGDTLERLRLTLKMPEKDWLELVGLSPRAYSDVKAGRAQVSIAHLNAVAQDFDLSLESFMSGDIDFQAVAAKSSGEVGFIPERYRNAAFSFRRSSVNALNYIEEFFGWKVRAQALRRLQVDESVFANPEEKISVRFVSDLCEFLYSRNVTPNDFFSMGAYSVVTYQNSPISARLSRSRDVRELFENMIVECLPRFVERNYIYSLSRLGPTSCEIKAELNPELVDALNGQKAGNTHFCQNKLGHTAAIPAYLGLPFATVMETTCVHRGDDACRFEVDFEQAARSARGPRIATA